MLRPEQLREVAELLMKEADKPRLDEREYGKCTRAAKSAYARLAEAEEKIAELLTGAGKTNEEITAVLNDLRAAADRDRSARGSAPRRRRVAKQEPKAE